jgi:hypothetical protein
MNAYRDTWTLMFMATIAVACGKGSSAPTPRPQPSPTPSPSPISNERTSTIDAVEARLGPDVQLISAQCDANSKTASSSDHIARSDGDSVVIKGEICPASASETGNLIFLVEAAGDIGDEDEGNGVTCGRLDAAKALLNKLGGSAAGDGLTVSMVRYATTAVIKVTNRNADAFIRDDLTYANFCGDDGGLTGSNFEDAFEKAASILSTGGKVSDGTSIYMLTTGDPSRSLSGSDEEGARSGVQKIYALNPNIPLNALTLGGIRDSDRALMVELAKGDKRVITVPLASDMATKILDFESRPASSPMTIETLSATITDGSATRTVKVLKATKHATKPVYHYELEPLKPFANSGRKTRNTVKVIDSRSQIESVTEFEF